MSKLCEQLDAEKHRYLSLKQECVPRLLSARLCFCSGHLAPYFFLSRFLACTYSARYFAYKKHCEGLLKTERDLNAKLRHLQQGGAA